MTLPVITNEQMYVADSAFCAEGGSEDELIERAGTAAAYAIMRRYDLLSRRFFFLIGPGNNGRDALVCARRLASFGARCEALTIGFTLEDPAGHGVARLHEAVPPLSPYDIVVDALFGAGLNRAPEGAAARALAALTPLPVTRIAIDIPSGVRGDDGRVYSPHFRAHLTITFFTKKRGHLLFPGREACGDILVLDIGLTHRHLKGPHLVFENAPARFRAALRAAPSDAHKYRRGHLFVVSGAMPHLGASRLAAIAGLRAGAGLVTLLCDEASAPIHAAQLTSVMVAPGLAKHPLCEIVENRKASAMVIGPGLGRQSEARALLGAALDTSLPLVIDADALHLLDALKPLPEHSGPCVLTPHAGEAIALGIDLDASKVEQARNLADTYKAVVVLKGPDTLIAEPSGRVHINVHASPALASAGSGDVLSGMIGGFLAQGVPAFDSACAAVWLHGDAAIALGTGLIAEDLPTELRKAVQRARSEAAL